MDFCLLLLFVTEFLAGIDQHGAWASFGENLGVNQAIMQDDIRGADATTAFYRDQIRPTGAGTDNENKAARFLDCCSMIDRTRSRAFESSQSRIQSRMPESMIASNTCLRLSGSRHLSWTSDRTFASRRA